MSAPEIDGVSLTHDRSDRRTQMVLSRRTNRVRMKQRHDAVALGQHTEDRALCHIEVVVLMKTEDLPSRAAMHW